MTAGIDLTETSVRAVAVDGDGHVLSAAHQAAADRDALLDYRAQAPHAAYMHPTDEHWLPFYIAAGAGGVAQARRLHDGVTYGVLGMDAYAFGDGAAALAASLADAADSAG